ncbi:MAG TPA: GNAT family protein [Chitinophagaceae bacterium]|jgi:RimJ/RimL family protein N-acetyltransferase|nr:GNAT family protein [Chitinophagaceae bacterium]
MEIDYSQLHGRHVYLEGLRPEHAAELRGLARDERLWEFTQTLLINETYDAQFDKYIATALDPASTGGMRSFIIRRSSDAKLIGMTRFYCIQPGDRRLSIGYTWYIPEVWGGPENKECKWLLLRYVFEVLNFNRVEFEVDIRNLRSQKAVEKIGGTREGVLRYHRYRADGTVRDTVVFSIIAPEWEAVSGRLKGLF